MKKNKITRLLIYLARWQLSTPILAIFVHLLSNHGEVMATIVANLIGGLIFYNVDRIIFRRTNNE